MSGSALSLIHTESAREAAGFRQSVMMPVIVRLWVAPDTLARGALIRGMLAPRIMSVLSLLGGGVHTCVFGLLVGAVCCVEGGGPGRGVVEGGVWEVPPCCPCVQGGRGGPFRLYGVSLGPVSSYTCVVWGRWRVTVILASSFLRLVVWGMM